MPKNNWSKITAFPLHPFLFSVYAVLGVYGTNANEIPAHQTLRPLIAILLFSAIFYFLAKQFSMDRDRAGYTTTLFVLWFFYFGHLFFFVPFLPITRDIPGNLAIVIIAWGGLLTFLGSNVIWKKFNKPSNITKTLNSVSLLVVLLPLASTSYIIHETNKQVNTIKKYINAESFSGIHSTTNSPDVYYVIVDGYGRNDVLREYYGYDNSFFTDALLERGFYIPESATSNYMQTELSLASMLNLNYLDQFTKGMENSQNRGPLNVLIQESSVRKIFRNLGYDFVALPSNVLFTKISNADRLIKHTAVSISELEGLLILKTVLGSVLSGKETNLQLPDYSSHRRIINSNFDILNNLSKTSNNKEFYFIHILGPHPPFVFKEDGSPTQPNRPYFIGDATGFPGSKDEYVTGYVSEIKYINLRLLNSIDTILNKTDGNAIIILHGDHGPGAFTNFTEKEQTCLKERFSVLTAIYLPTRDYSKFKPEISLVNLFPTLLNTYFNTNLPYVENRNYYSTWNRPYEYFDVTKDIDTCNYISNVK